jgi:hypothetical protein
MVPMLKADALTFFGGPTKLAAVCGLKSRQSVWNWPEVVPDDYQYRLHYLSQGRLPLSEHLKLPPPTRYASDPPGARP